MERITATHWAHAVGDVPFDHSLAVLASLWGYSGSELEQSLRDGGLALYRSLEGRALLHWVSVDAEHAVARVQLFGAGDVDGVRDLLSRLERQHHVRRTCSYLFPWERDEACVLEALGFEREAILRQHVYARGGAQDLWVYGRLSEDA